jgi:putative two-component system response regulator
MADDIATSHHEWWNGNGYPNHLKGEDIPLAARIMAVADVYDALVSKRVYKDPIVHAHALEIIYSESGTHFDPGVIDALRRIQDQIIDASSIQNSQP